MPTETEVRAAVTGYVEHLAARRREEWLDGFADGATLVDPVPSDPAVGREAIGEFFDGLMGMAERISVGPGALHVCGSQAALVYTVTAGPAGGGGVAFDAVGIFTVDDDGRIAQMSAYWEPSEIHPVEAG